MDSQSKKITHNVCVYGVAVFETASCPRGQTLTEDKYL